MTSNERESDEETTAERNKFQGKAIVQAEREESVDGWGGCTMTDYKGVSNVREQKKGE